MFWNVNLMLVNCYNNFKPHSNTIHLKFMPTINTL
jgi:hypothetical protein